MSIEDISKANAALSIDIQKLFIKKKWTLSLAESCTGGFLAACFTQNSGASQFFLGSLVTYSNELKIKILKVPGEVLQTSGAVSSEVASFMAQGVLNLTGSDFTMAVTGIAGPTGGSVEKPVGTVWGAIGKRGEPPCAWQFHAAGNRKMVIEYSINALLTQLLVYCKLFD